MTTDPGEPEEPEKPDRSDHQGVTSGAADRPTGIRLQKVLAAAGVASRRASEDLIVAGRVEVDGVVVDELGARVDPTTAVVRVDGNRIPVATDRVYLALNKPRGVVSTMSDPQGRRCLGDFVRDRPERLFHVGRLDTDTEGLILLVNDGDFTHRMTHPSYGVPKTYVATVDGLVGQNLQARIPREGVELDDGPVSVDTFRVLQRHGRQTMVELVLHEGRKHVVRRLLAEVGHPVTRLVRTAIGPVHLGGMKPGTVRPLTSDELGTLLDAVDL